MKQEIVIYSMLLFSLDLLKSFGPANETMEIQKPKNNDDREDAT